MKQELELARDDDGWYGIYEGELKKDRRGDWDGKRLGEQYTGNEFRAIFGRHLLRKGRKKRIKRILIELED